MTAVANAPPGSSGQMTAQQMQLLQMQHQLDMQNKQLAAQKKMNDDRVAAQNGATMVNAFGTGLRLMSMFDF